MRAKRSIQALEGQVFCHSKWCLHVCISFLPMGMHRILSLTEDNVKGFAQEHRCLPLITPAIENWSRS